jgi:hypothetical protein
MSEANGSSQPAAAPDRPEGWEHLGLLADVPPEALERIAIQMNASFAETQRRDGNAVDHARRMTRAFFGVLVALGIAVGVIVWMFAHSPVQPHKCSETVIACGAQRCVPCPLGVEEALRPNDRFFDNDSCA